MIGGWKGKCWVLYIKARRRGWTKESGVPGGKDEVTVEGRRNRGGTEKTWWSGEYQNQNGFLLSPLSGEGSETPSLSSQRSHRNLQNVNKSFSEELGSLWKDSYWWNETSRYPGKVWQEVPGFPKRFRVKQPSIMLTAYFQVLTVFSSLMLWKQETRRFRA